MFGPCTLCTGAVWQIMGDYTALATRTGFVPARVQNIPTGAVVTDLMAGEAFGMAVLQSGAVYVAVKPDVSFATRICMPGTVSDWCANAHAKAPGHGALRAYTGMAGAQAPTASCAGPVGTAP